MITNEQNGIVIKRKLTPTDLQAIDRLSALCLTHDGVEPKLNRDTLRRRDGETVNDFLIYEKGELVAYAAIFSYNTLEAKISGMVHPDYRRRGLARSLLQAAAEEINNRNIETQTLIVPTRSTTGQAFAKEACATLSFSEYEMDLAAPRELANRKPNLHLKNVEAADVPFFARTISRAFDVPEADVTLKLGDPSRHYYLICLGEEAIGTIAARTEEKQTMIYGFVVVPEHQGRGYGRQALNDTVQDLMAKGNSRIRLEVDCHNEGALGLYLSCGFEVTSGYDYYKL